MYKKTCGIIAVTILLIICGSLWFLSASANPVFAFNLEIVGDNLGISITHDSPLFNMENMAPGETESSTISVKNQGDAPLSLTLDSLMENGDDALFEKLEFTVEDDNGTRIYDSGSLKNVNHVVLGSILPGEEKIYILSVCFPPDAGNEFQNKAVSVMFIFTAYGDGETDYTTEANMNVTKITDEDVPLASGIATESDYSTETIQSEIAGNTTIEDENIPLGGVPKTGESYPKAFYLLGLLLAAIGLKTGLKIRNRKDKV